MAERLEVLLGPVAEDVTVATFHALGPGDPAGEPRRGRPVGALPDRRRERRVGRRAGHGHPRRPAHAAGEAAPRPAGPGRLPTAPAGRGCSSTNTRTSTPCSTSCCGCSCPDDGNLCAIGDPDQAIYSFRGADVSFFLRFAADYPEARTVRLTRNYRSTAPILATAVQAIAPTSLVRGRRLDPARFDPEAPQVGHLPGSDRGGRGRLRGAYDRRTGRRPVAPVARLGPGRRARDADRRRCRSVTSPFSTAPTPSPAPCWTRWPAPAYRCRSARTTACATGPASRRIARELRFHGSAPLPTAADRKRRGRRCWTGWRRRPWTPARSAHRRPTCTCAVDLLAPLAARCGDDVERVPRRDRHRRRGRRARSARRGGHAAHPARVEGPGVSGRVHRRLRGRPAAAARLRPAGRSPEEEAEAIAEERRLFFVGLTRAQQRLFVRHARRRHWRGSERDMSPSRFFAAIDPRLFEQRGDEQPRRARDHTRLLCVAIRRHSDRPFHVASTIRAVAVPLIAS